MFFPDIEDYKNYLIKNLKIQEILESQQINIKDKCIILIQGRLGLFNEGKNPICFQTIYPGMSIQDTL